MGPKEQRGGQCTENCDELVGRMESSGSGSTVKPWECGSEGIERESVH